MALTVTDNRTLVDHADADTGWSSPVGGESITEFTADPNPVELSGSLGIAVSEEVGELLFTLGGGVDLSSSTLVYVWVQANGTMETLANGGIQLVLGDGTNTIAFNIAGSDLAVFRHSEGPVSWMCLMLDTSNLPSSRDLRGAVGDLLLNSLTEFGANFEVLSKALGGASNCFLDTIRYGNGGIDILGGTEGDRGSFNELAAEDRDDTSGKAYGVFRKLEEGVFSCQAPLTFGETVSATHYFHTQDEGIFWENRGQANGRYNVIVQSNGTGVGSFRSGVISGSENGTNGSTFVMPVNSGNVFDASDVTLDFCQLYDTTFKQFSGGILFSADATNGVNHDVFDCLFDGCGQVQPGRVDMKNCSFVNSLADEALLIDNDNNTLLARLDFLSDGTGHAIHLNPQEAATVNYTLVGFTYTGYAASDGSTGNECILVDSPTDEDINLTISFGDTPSIMLAAGYSGNFTLISSVPMDFKVIDKDNNAIVGVQITAFQVSDDSSVMTATDTDGSGEVSTTYGASTPVDIYYRARKASGGGTNYINFSAFGTIESDSGISVTITMQEDTNNAT